MKKTISLLVILTLVTISTAALCGSPEDTIKEMMEAVKAKDWEKAASYIDFEGMAKAMKEMMIEDIDGLMVIIGDLVGTCGNLPEIVNANVDSALISKG